MLTIALLAALAAIHPVQGESRARLDELQPSIGLFGAAPDPYCLAVRTALIGEGEAGKCQMVVLPSFSEEWCVFLEREDQAPPALSLHRLGRSLWGQMMEVLSGHGTKTEFSMDTDAMTAAFRQIDVHVERLSAPIDFETADLLEQVWWKMLGRARYSEELDGGVDGVRYHFAHWGPGTLRTGEVWSPEEGSRTGTLVMLGEEMKDLVAGPSRDRPGLEGKLRSEAKALLERIEKLASETQGR